MSYPDHTKVVAFSAADHKHAALFFERIVPLHSAADVPLELTFPFWEFDLGRPEWKTSLADLCATPIEDEEQLPKNYRSFLCEAGRDAESLAFIDELFRIREAYPEDRTYTFEELKDAIDAKVKQIYHWNTIQHQLSFLRNKLATLFSSVPDYPQPIYGVPVLGESEEVDSGVQNGIEDSVFFTLSNLHLVDTDHAEWQQIIEIRNDPQAKSQLRNLRLYLEDFSGKSKSYIEDSLERKIDQYDSACKKHGFNLKATSFKTLLDSKSLLGVAAITAAGLLTGQPAVASVGAGVGAVFQSARFVLSILESKHDFAEFKREHELAYIFRAKESLQDQSLNEQVDDS